MNGLWRWLVFTLVGAIAATLLIVAIVERAHREAVRTDYELSAARTIDAELSAPLDAVARTGRIDASARGALDRTAAQAREIDGVAGLRVYGPDGRPAYPIAAKSAASDVQRAIAANHPIVVDLGPTVSVFAPIRGPGARSYVVALDFVALTLGSPARDRGPIFGSAAIIGAIVCVSLAVLGFGAWREVEMRRNEAFAAFLQTLGVMADAIDMRDPRTAGHAKRVAAYSRRIAIELKLTPTEIYAIESGALLHDIGRIGIPDAVLQKAGQLDEDERRIMQTHPALGARLLGNAASMEPVVRCVLHHHERLDGTGYPMGLSGDQIPLAARIVAVADTFDAMTTERPYRAMLSAEVAIRELTRVAGTQLDARIVALFARLIETKQMPTLTGAPAATSRV